MTYCNHLFIKVCSNHESPKQDPNNTSAYFDSTPYLYAVVVCAWCGHVRHIYADGTIKIIKEHGETKPQGV